MIYIVSGFMRSGTSMMMKALTDGGMDSVWSEERNELVLTYSDNQYTPNKYGLYEIPLYEYSEVDFPLKYRDKLIKVMAWGLQNLSVDEYKIIVMMRDKEEIRQSYEGFFRKPLTGIFFKELHQRMDKAIHQLYNRKDVKSLHIINYRDIVNNPKKYFNELKNDNWNIDVDRCVSAVDPTQYRFRIENLTVGI